MSVHAPQSSTIESCTLAEELGDCELPSTAISLAVKRWRDGAASVAMDMVVNEVPVALVFNGISHAVMLATPDNLEDFAYGFACTEGIVTQASEVYGIEIRGAGNLGIEVHIHLASEAFARLKLHRRTLAGRTGCGLCGAESLQQVFRQPPEMQAMPAPALTQAAIACALQSMLDSQPLQQHTGASHACALVDSAGQLLLVREDVGRHNALDKLIGAVFRLGQTAHFEQAWILTTSRASYEMVQKVAMVGGRALVALSAPTALAVQLAYDYQITLVGFARAGHCVVYHGELTADEVDLARVAI